jgi:hypothetical protein
MFYGDDSVASATEDPASVWDDNFVGVWHLSETDIDGDAGDIKDSTSYGHNITTSGMGTNDQVPGKIGGSFDFDGDNDRVISTPCPDALKLLDTDFTIQIWAFPLDTGEENLYVSNDWNHDPGGWGIGVWGDDVELFIGNDKTITNTDPVTEDQWNHITVAFDDSAQDALFYVNGTWTYTDASTGTDEVSDGGRPFVIGVDPRDLSG